VAGGVVDEEVKPGLPLAEKLGQLFTALAGGVASRLDVEVRGEIASKDVRVIQLAALKGVFADVVADTVTYVNAPLLAEQRDLTVTLTTDAESPDWRNLVVLRGTLPGGQTVSVSGTLTGQRQMEKLVAVNGFDMEIGLAEHMAILSYTDRPGIVGVVGQLLGEAGINIGGMQVSRDVRGGHALIALTVDTAIPPALLETITEEIGAVFGRAINLTQS
jgi:D-3-phosphoglycerate dehydrogenase